MMPRKRNPDIAELIRGRSGGGSWATDVAEALVKRGVPFRQAHEVVGGLVARLEADGLDLASAPDGSLASHHDLLSDEDRGLADPRRSLAARSSAGGTAPENVIEGARRLRKALAEGRSGPWFDGGGPPS